MIYMKSKDGDLRIVVLETANLERIKAGKPAYTPDKEVLIAWTPDPVWLSMQLMDVEDGDAVKIARLIDQGSKRPQKSSNRPHHEPYLKKFFRGGE